MKTWLFAVLLLLPACYCARSLGADKPPAKSDTLDDLFEGLPPAESKPPTPTPEDELPPGEDLELGGTKDPFARIATKMHRSQQALHAGNTKTPTQDLQEEILLDLDALLKNMEKKCQGGQCNKPGSGSSAGASKSGSQKPSNKPATDSTTRVGKPNESAAGDETTAADAMKDVWGHLPPKVREAMQNASLEEFLPKYDRLIEEFYRRLAEQPARGG